MNILQFQKTIVLGILIVLPIFAQIPMLNLPILLYAQIL